MLFTLFLFNVNSKLLRLTVPKKIKNYFKIYTQFLENHV
ncbi:hypothetical protein B4065_2299 [Caldibacillus thermoamylovorans]|nr:hypothetical protein B4065_2299 [Caldibacillus thermoamylovorans]